mmetsp:Transcript_34034/g.105096  ORF Transcript_34034/g.105096 Transcript_34034/m.105096 type:complete len:290 (-) Transcript_34034:77-946(-)
MKPTRPSIRTQQMTYIHMRSASTSFTAFFTRLLSDVRRSVVFATFSSVSSSSTCCTLSSRLMFMAFSLSCSVPACILSRAWSMRWSCFAICSKNNANSSSSRRFCPALPTSSMFVSIGAAGDPVSYPGWRSSYRSGSAALALPKACIWNAERCRSYRLRMLFRCPSASRARRFSSSVVAFEAMLRCIGFRSISIFRSCWRILARRGLVTCSSADLPLAHVSTSAIVSRNLRSAMASLSSSCSNGVMFASTSSSTAYGSFPAASPMLSLAPGPWIFSFMTRSFRCIARSS